MRILTTLALLTTLIFATEVSAQRTRAVRRLKFLLYDVPTRHINALLADSDGSLWFTGERSGRFRSDHETEFLDSATYAMSPPIAVTADKRLCGVALESSIRCIRSDGSAEIFPVRLDARIGALLESRDGSLWFTEPQKDRIGRVTPDGAVHEFALPPSLTSPGGMVIDRDGTLFFATFRAAARVIADDSYQVFAADSIFEARGRSEGFLWPIAMTADGSIWLPIGSPSRTGVPNPRGAIVKMASDGTFTTAADLSYFYSPSFLTADRDDGVWFVQTSENYFAGGEFLVHLRSDGTSISYNLPPPLPELVFRFGGIAVDPSGTVWVALNNIYSHASIAKLMR